MSENPTPVRNPLVIQDGIMVAWTDEHGNVFDSRVSETPVAKQDERGTVTYDREPHPTPKDSMLARLNRQWKRPE